LGNIPTKFHNKPEAKALVGLIPILQDTIEEQQTPQFRQLIRTTFYKYDKEYRNLNGLSADTYESLHKHYIKSPYRKSNKRNINLQILQKATQTLTLKEIYERIVLQDDQTKINVGEFVKQYCTIPLHLFKSIIASYKHNKECCSEILEGLQHFIPAMNDYFDLMFTLEKNIEELKITLILFESLILSNKEKVRATKSYYNMPMFSDIAVYMDPEQDFNTFGEY
ncbi:25945_t:CDS:2, partial [Gigaspora margarita]